MGAAMDIEPRTSMERHLMDRDREGQLYLEARRQQAVQDLLANRTSFLSTITPPSTNPSSAASSLFHEPSASSSSSSSSSEGAFHTTLVASVPNTPTSPLSPLTSMSSTGAHSPATTATFLSLAPSLQNIIPVIKKTRQRSKSASAGQGRSPSEPDRSMFAISPSSLEYQLTASLLQYHRSPVPTASLTQCPAKASQPRAGSQSKVPRQQKPRRGTTNTDTRIDTSHVTSTSSRSTGHRHNSSRDKNTSEGEEFKAAYKASHTTIEGLTPTSLLGSMPSSPTDAKAQQVPSEQQDQTLISFNHVPLPPIPPSPPLPPLPPKSPRSLIAHYFPGSLPPPPSRERVTVNQKEPLVAPTPFKTPTFGPALLLSSSSSASYYDRAAPPLPSPSASFHYIPSANISRTSTAQAPGHDEVEFLSPSGQPSPSTSALGFSVSTSSTRAKQPRMPSDMDLFVANGARGRFPNHNHHHQHPQQLHNNFNRNHPINNFSIHNFNTSHPSEISAEQEQERSTSITVFLPEPPASASSLSSISAGVRRNSNAATPTTPIYPRGLMPSSSTPLGEHHHPVIIRVQQKAIPYVRELVPGKEVPGAAPSAPSSTNTSRDLQIVIEDITGRIRTNRTSFDPWPLYVSPLDEKPLPPVRREKGTRYWVFSDQEGVVLGPFLFLLGHLCPILWWIGSVYPSTEHPDNLKASERTRAGNEQALSDRMQEHPPIKWLQRQLRSAGATIASIKTNTTNSKQQPSTTIATLQIVRIDQEGEEREGSTIAPQSQAHPTNISTIHVPLPPPLRMMPQEPMDTHGPWSAEDHAPSLFEQRMEYDRKMLRYELNLRWKRINLIWSIGSFVLAISITAFLVGSSAI